MGNCALGKYKTIESISVVLLHCAFFMSLPAVVKGNEKAAVDISKVGYLSSKPVVSHFDIPAQSLDTALIQLGLQADVNVIFASNFFEGKRSSPLVGGFTLANALKVLLLDSGFEFKISELSDSVVIAPKKNLANFPSVKKKQSDTPGDRQMEVVVVSARRRDEDLFDVPMAISVVSGDRIDERGVRNSVDLSSEFPNTKIKLIRGTNSTMTAFIRGIGHEDPIAGIDSSVGFYVDDVYIGRPQGLLSELYFIERVEVLRGPQGTLYGRNTVGGAVKYVTREILDKPELEVRSRFGSYNLKELGLYASSPIEPLESKVSVSLTSIQRDGFGKNTTTGEQNYDKDIFSVRGKYKYEPSEALNFRAAIDYSEDRSTAIAGYDVVSGEKRSSLYDSAAGISQSDHPINKFKMTTYGISTGFEVNVSTSSRFSGIASYRLDNTDSPIDFDARKEDILDVYVNYENEQSSLELQYLGEFNVIDFLLGGYYLESNAFNAFDAVLGEQYAVLFTSGKFDLSTLALFSDVNITLSSLSIGLGVRVTEERKQAHIFRDVFVAFNDEPLISPHFYGELESIVTPVFDESGEELVPSYYGEIEDKVVTPKFEVSWKTEASGLLYFSYRNGFKGGSFDPRGDYSKTAIRRGYKPENIDAYEIGFKLNPPSANLRAGFAAFYNDYSDIQIDGDGDVFPGSGDEVGVPIPAVIKSANAEIKGVEINGKWSFYTGYSLELELGLLDARYTEFLDQRGVDVAKSRSLAHAPEESLSLTIENERSVWGGTLRLYFNSSYQSETQHSEIANDGWDQKGYSVENLGVTWQNHNGSMMAGVHVSNVFDKRYSTAVYDFGNAISVFYGEPQMLTFSYSLRR